MASNVLVIVEYGAHKQRISLRTNACFIDLCQEIYSLFKLDINKSKVILQRQDPLRHGHFIDLEEHLFLAELKQHAINGINMPRIRLRLVPANNASPGVNGFGQNGSKDTRSSTSSQPQQSGEDESDRASNSSVTTINIKQLIKKCLANLRETTENIQLLDRCLHPEDYVNDESQSLQPPSSTIDQSLVSINPNGNSQISHTLSMSNIRTTQIPSSTKIVDELVPALNQLINMEQKPSLSPLTKPPVTPAQTPTILKSNSQPQSGTKSFSNRLGLIPAHTPQPSVQEPKSTGSSQRPSPQMVKPSSVIIPPPPSASHTPTHKVFNERQPMKIPPPPKCNIELKQFPPATTIEGIVSVASNASYFFLQLIDEKKNEFDQLAKSIHDYYSSTEHDVGFRPAPGDFCAAMYTEDARWYRARVVRSTSAQTCEVFYIDYGNMEDLPTDLLRELLPDFAHLPARAIACTVAEILPPIGQEGWTKRATFAFASRCSNERVQATIVDSTNLNWPMHFVHLHVCKSQEDIGSSLENCKVARRVNNNEICQFWSNKIRCEQYILYNLQESYSHRFPIFEQGPTNDRDQDGSNTFLSSSLQQSPVTDIPIVEQTDVSTNTPIPDEANNEQTPDVDSTTEKKEDESTPASASTVLNPNARPFFFPVKGMSSVESSTSDEEEINEKCPTPTTADSSNHCRIPLKHEVIVDTKLMPSTPLLQSWLPVEVTHIETPTRFYIRYIYGPGWNLGNGSRPELIDKRESPEKNAVLKEMTKEMTECYSKHKSVSPGDSFARGELVAVKSRSQWHRGRFIEYKPNIDFAHIFFVDEGYTRALPIQMIRMINNRFVLHAEQAHLVHLHQPGHRRGRIEWTSDQIEEFRKMTKIEQAQLYARIAVEPDNIELVSYDPFTKTWFSFYEHYFVRHLIKNETESKT